MSKIIARSHFVLFACLLAGACSVSALEHSEADRHQATLAIYEPSRAFPFGKRNPDAPAELAQYEFMIGEWDCNERLRQPEGGWKEVQSLVRGNYYLNGRGIMNHTFMPDDASLMTYQYNPATSNWWIINSRHFNW